MTTDTPAPTGGGILDLTWPVPDRITLSDDRASLVCAMSKPTSVFAAPAPLFSERKQAVAERPGLLRAFMALDGDEARTLRFAQRWGLLGLCEHRLPADHRSHHRLWMIHMALADFEPPDESASGTVGDRVLSEDDSTWRGTLPDPVPCKASVRESLSDWWFWSKRASALVSAAKELRASQPLSAAPRLDKLVDLMPAYVPNLRLPPPLPAEHPTRSKADILREQRARVAAMIQELLDLAEVTLAMTWRTPTDDGAPSKPSLGYKGTGLFAAIAIEIALNATTATGFFICDYCGAAYTRLRAVQPGKNGYCPDCKDKGRQAAWRAKDPARRKREADKRKARANSPSKKATDQV